MAGQAGRQAGKAQTRVLVQHGTRSGEPPPHARPASQPASLTASRTAARLKWGGAGIRLQGYREAGIRGGREGRGAILQTGL